MGPGSSVAGVQRGSRRPRRSDAKDNSNGLLQPTPSPAQGPGHAEPKGAPSWGRRFSTTAPWSKREAGSDGCPLGFLLTPSAVAASRPDCGSKARGRSPRSARFPDPGSYNSGPGTEGRDEREVRGLSRTVAARGGCHPGHGPRFVRAVAEPRCADRLLPLGVVVPGSDRFARRYVDGAVVRGEHVLRLGGHTTPKPGVQCSVAAVPFIAALGYPSHRVIRAPDGLQLPREEAAFSISMRTDGACHRTSSPTGARAPLRSLGTPPRRRRHYTPLLISHDTVRGDLRSGRDEVLRVTAAPLAVPHGVIAAPATRTSARR